MSEGTMQRPAQREQLNQRAKRLSRVFLGAATVPVMLIAAGCSSDSGSDSASKNSGAETSTSASPSPTVQAAAYNKLPEACDVLSGDTLGDLVPKAGKSGKEGASNDTSTRASCSWSSLDNNGVDGSQFRWLNVSLLRFESDVTRGSGDKLAQEYYAKQVKDVQAVEGAKNVKSEPVTGTGDEATAVRYDLKKKEGAFKQQTIVARVENVVITLDYNGAGLAGEKTPSADTLTKLAKQATKEAVTAVTKANGTDGGSDDGTAGANPSKSASKSPSKKATAKS
ncbi:secreted protein [Streptomyces davaonensis JCM 4913]|uniref:Secreted protein n=1 Tax=Streptomyces davaonensis (strain DSM 101723 / JCM 4913 / KCC S-0913 / 768) TaxID=1214101 RepID=K4QWB0_STRDJ|nr:DUF3558 family protein [Streptomyces davaonensis]CCK28341.1 secreted protein [Streptomyces davaonensis JCM 4913]